MKTEIISLNRSAKIRVKTYTGEYRNLSTTTSRWIDLDDAYNRKRLNSHSSIGQWITINSNGGTPSEQDLTAASPYISVSALSISARVRVKGYRQNTEAYGLWDLGLLLKEDPSDRVWINLGADDGNDDPDDGRYNRQQLNHHRSIGQYVQSLYDAVGIKALNRSARVRVKNSAGEIVELGTTGYTWINIDDRETLKLLNRHSSIGQWVANDFHD
jgi:hypothetical protein